MNSMKRKRKHFGATTLGKSKIVVAGGWGRFRLNSPELFDAGLNKEDDSTSELLKKQPCDRRAD